MEIKMTWEEMKEHYPHEWLLIVDYDTDESGHIIAGIVARHSTEKAEVYRLPALKKHQLSSIPEKALFPVAGGLMQNFTTFDTKAPYICLPIQVTSTFGSQHEYDAIFDTGAPRTEFSDRALKYDGFIKNIPDISIANGLQSYHIVLLGLRLMKSLSRTDPFLFHADLI